MMALNLASDLLLIDDDYSLTQFANTDDKASPHSPSESESGISSLEDSEEIKKPLTPSPVCSESDDLGQAHNESESEESEESSGSIHDESDVVQSDELIPEPPKPLPTVRREWKVQYEGRNVLDLGNNLTDLKFNLRFADLPTNNLQFFFTNRSQYHRLGASGPRQEYSLDKCRCCNFDFPNIQAASATSSSAGSVYQTQAQSVQNSFTYSLSNFLKNQTNEYVQTPQQTYVPPPTPITKKNIAPPNYGSNMSGMGNYNQKMGTGLNGNGYNMNLNNKQNYFGGGNVMNQTTIANLLNLVNMRPNNNNANNSINTMGNMRCYSGNNGMQSQFGLYKQF